MNSFIRMTVESLLADMVTRLSVVPGVKAIVLGGSRATDSHGPDSDVDLGLYYQNGYLDVPRLREIARAVNDFPQPVVTNLGSWGRWVNGGSWLTIRGQRLDWLYRDIDFVSETIDDALDGRYQKDYSQQPPYGFNSYMYCAETAICRILYDPDGIVHALKAKVATYPKPLQHAIISDFMWDAEFALAHCKKAASRGQVLSAAGCLTRIASDWVQTVYALNETYFLSEKRFYQQAQTFAVQPRDFTARLEKMLGEIGETQPDLLATVSRAEGLFDEMKALCGELYRPRF